jgi:hypothetical protein
MLLMRINKINFSLLLLLALSVAWSCAPQTREQTREAAGPEAEQEQIMTVQGAISPDQLGLTQPYEHVLVAGRRR